MDSIIELSSKEGSLGIGPDGLMYLTAQVERIVVGSKFKVGEDILRVKHIEYYHDPPDMFMAEVIGVAS
jgi:hypothetical protein